MDPGYMNANPNISNPPQTLPCAASLVQDIAEFFTA